MRVCVVGDELVAGLGDARGLGWVGRVVARTTTEEPLFVAPLAVPGESTSALSGRWEAETQRRFGAHSDNRLVVGLGPQDLFDGTSLARSRLNLANVLDVAAASRVSCFVVGPPPRPDVDDDALAQLSQAFSDVCRRRHVPYVETHEPLRTHDQWHADVAAGDGIHPGQAGYGLLAWLVLHNGWHSWLGLPSEAG
ncbi:GDSL-type esterase/lipase family protein [Georgenia alba]|uniref:GDSL-type esterase/lipase family protein n=1 Tax=Georgenia alba TaxID=2233858 RepID=A0ABW2QA68_9MICO